jgi:hypothetical protein
MDLLSNSKCVNSIIHLQSYSVISPKIPNKFCRYNGVSLQEGCVVKGRKIFDDKIEVCRNITSFNTIMYFKFKLQLKFRDHKIYSSVTANLHTGVGKKYINWKISISKNKSYGTGLLIWTLSIPSFLNHLSSASLTSLHSGFRNRFMLLSILIKCTNSFGCFPLSFGS